MARNWSAVKSKFKNIAVATTSLKPKKRTFKNKGGNEEETPPDLDGTAKELEGLHLTDDEEAAAVPLAFGADPKAEPDKSPKKKKKSKKETSKGTADKTNPFDDGEETTETTGGGGGGVASPAFASFGLENSSHHANSTDHSRMTGDTDSVDSAMIPAHQEFGAVDYNISERVSENPSSSAVATRSSKKSSKSSSKKRGKRLRAARALPGSDKRQGEKGNAATSTDEEVTYLGKALGMDTFKGCCLRHPDQSITSLSPCYEPVCKCALCQSELEVDSERMERHREYVATEKDKMSAMARNTKWKQRTQIANWHSNSQIDLLSGVSDEGKEEKITEREWLDQVVERILQVQAWKTLGKQPLQHDPDYARYFRLFRIGVPMDAVKFTAERDGFDPTVLDLSPDLPLDTQRPNGSKSSIESGDSIFTNSTSDLEGEEQSTTDALEKTQIAFNRLRAKDLLQAATLATLKRRHKEGRVKEKNGGPKKTRKSSTGGKKKDVKKRSRTGKDGKRIHKNDHAHKLEADDKDLVIRKLKDELEKKEMEIESLHEKVNEMEQHLHTSSSSHRSLGSMSFDEEGNPVLEARGVAKTMEEGASSSGVRIQLRTGPNKVGSGSGRSGNAKTGKDDVAESIEGKYSFGSSSNALDAMETLSRKDIEAPNNEERIDEQNGMSASSSDRCNSVSSFENEFDAKATNTPASALVGNKVVEAPGNVSRHEKVEQSDSFDNEYDADFSDPAIQFVQDNTNGASGSRPSLPEVNDSSDASDSEYTSGSSEPNGEALTTTDATAAIDDHIRKASSDEDDDILELAARVHATEEKVDACDNDDLASDSVPGANVGVGGLPAPVRSNSLDSAHTEDDTSDSDFDLALEASMRGREDVSQDASESFADEYDSVASPQDDTEMANAYQAAISNDQSDDESALELAAARHDDDQKKSKEDRPDRGEDTLAQPVKVQTGFAESDDDEDLALAASLHDTEDHRNQQKASESCQNEHPFDAQETSNSYIASPDILDAEDAVSSLVTPSHQTSRGDVDAAASSDEEEDLALAAAVHSENAVDQEQEDASASASIAHENDGISDSNDDDGFIDGRGTAAIASIDDSNDEATLELAASLHASNEESKVPDDKQDSFADEFNAKASSDDEKEDKFADEYNPESIAFDANSNDDDDDDEAALDTATAAHANGDGTGSNDPSESSSGASYTSGASKAEGNGDGTETHAVFEASTGFDDANNDALELAASLHNVEDHDGNDIPVQDPQPEPKSLAKMELLAQSTDSSDNEDDELMMAAALLEREDDSSIGDRGGVTGYDDELSALHSYQQADGLFYDGTGLAPYTDDPPVLDDMASDSSYEPASSDDDDDASNLDSNGRNALDAEGNDSSSYESYGSYHSDDNGDKDGAKEVV